jgi:hypothetical protein
MDSASLIHLGDIKLTMALAGAVTTWLVVARAYRSAVLWCIAIAVAFGAVAASKIVYMGWGLQSTVLDFQAVSGHATGAAAVLPMILYLMAGFHRRSLQTAALLTGLFISGMVAVSLVRHDEHTASEALAGWCIGTCASLTTWTQLRHDRIELPLQDIGAALVVMGMIAICVQKIPVSWWLAKAALILSGAPYLHRWEDS